MPSTDEIFNVILQVQNAQKAEDLRTAIEADEKAVRDLNGVLRQNGSLTQAQQQQQQQAASALITHRQELANVEKALQQTTAGTRNYIGMMQQGSYAIQDFTSTSGDLGAKLNSVSNNLMMVAASFGPYGIAVGTGLALTVAMVKNWDAIASLWENRNPLPEATSNIIRMDTELKSLNKELEDLHKKGELTNEQLVRFNDLTEKAAELQANLNEKKKAQQFIDTATGAPIDEETVDRRNIIKKALAGQEFHNGMSFDKQLESVITGSAMSEGRPLTNPKDVENIKDSIKKGLENGEPEAVRRLLEMIDQDKTSIQAFRGDFPSKLAAALPESMEAEAQGKKNVENYEKRKKRKAEDTERFLAHQQGIQQVLDQDQADHKEKIREDTERFNARQQGIQQVLDDDKKEQRERAEQLRKGLGETFIDSAGWDQLDIDRMKSGRKRNATQGAFENWLTNAAQQQLIANGVPAAHAESLATGAPQLIRDSLTQQSNQARAAAPLTGIPAVTDYSGELQQVMQMQQGALDAQREQAETMMNVFRQMGTMYAQTRALASQTAANLRTMYGQSGGGYVTYGSPFP